MTCLLCGQPIDGTAPAVPTTDGQQVHIACADQAARAASQGRASRALVTALAVAGLFFIAAWRWPVPLVVALTPFGLLLHVAFNRHWWQLCIQSARLWLWRTGHGRGRRPRR